MPAALDVTREMELVLESGGPALCTIHAAEVAELDNPELDDGSY